MDGEKRIFAIHGMRKKIARHLKMTELFKNVKIFVYKFNAPFIDLTASADFSKAAFSESVSSN